MNPILFTHCFEEFVNLPENEPALLFRQAALDSFLNHQAMETSAVAVVINDASVASNFSQAD